MFDHLELKFMPQTDPALDTGNDLSISGYASFFDERDQGGDRVMPGAFAASIAQANAAGRSIKMLWQHDPAQPIGVWDQIIEDHRGLRVMGRLLPGVARAQEAKLLLDAGAIDGLSIGYHVKQARPDGRGGRILQVLDLWCSPVFSSLKGVED